MNELDKKVNWLFENNHRVGSQGGKDYDYTCASPKNYPHQWLWDSCFHAVVLTRFNPERAKREVQTLLLNQSDRGFVPCVSIWQKRFPFEELFYADKITQPPVIPITVEIIFKETQDMDFLKIVYPKLKDFMLWFKKNRDQNKNGLIEVVHPWETGIDSSPSFDRQLGITKPHPNFPEFMARYLQILHFGKTFKSENVLVNSIYGKSLGSMLRLARVMGEKSDAEIFNGEYEKTITSLIGRCWSEEQGIFYDLDNSGRQVKVKTISSLMPLVLEDLPNRYVESLVRHLTNSEEFWPKYPVPSVSMTERTFSSEGGFVLWRGPTWINTNWFLYEALKNHGYTKIAVELSRKTKEIVKKNGFWEYYNPFTGEGYGQPDLGWSALASVM